MKVVRIVRVVVIAVAAAGCVVAPGDERLAAEDDIGGRLLALHLDAAEATGRSEHTARVLHGDDTLLEVQTGLLELPRTPFELAVSVASTGAYQGTMSRIALLNVGFMVVHRSARSPDGPWEPLGCGDAAPDQLPSNRGWNLFDDETGIDRARRTIRTRTLRWAATSAFARHQVESFADCGVTEDDPTFAVVPMPWSDWGDVDGTFSFEVSVRCPAEPLAQCPSGPRAGDGGSHRIRGNHELLYATDGGTVWRIDPHTGRSRAVGSASRLPGRGAFLDVAVTDRGTLEVLSRDEILQMDTASFAVLDVSGVDPPGASALAVPGGARVLARGRSLTLHDAEGVRVILTLPPGDGEIRDFAATSQEWFVLTPGVLWRAELPDGPPMPLDLAGLLGAGEQATAVVTAQHDVLLFSTTGAGAMLRRLGALQRPWRLPFMVTGAGASSP